MMQKGKCLDIYEKWRLYKSERVFHFHPKIYSLQYVDEPKINYQQVAYSNMRPWTLWDSFSSQYTATSSFWKWEILIQNFKKQYRLQ